MNEESIVNSRSYWNTRFASDWEANLGRQQTRFFCQLAITLLPTWLAVSIRRERLSICDWGCALGDGTDLFSQTFSESAVTGVDFSDAAIRKASSYYPHCSFRSDDFLNEDLNRYYDIVFSSNTLEHFASPWSVFQNISKYANRFVVILVPYREFPRHLEHAVTFDEINIPISPTDKWHLVYHNICEIQNKFSVYWVGQQILLVYATPDTIFQSRLILADILSNGVRLRHDYAGRAISEGLVSGDRAASLEGNATLDDKEAALATMHDALAEIAADRDTAIAARRATLDDKEAALATMHDALAGIAAERDAAIAARRATLDDKEAAIATMHDALGGIAAERDAAIAARRATLDDKEAALATMHDALAGIAAERDAAIAARRATLDDKEAALTRMHDVLVQSNEYRAAWSRQKQKRKKQRKAITWRALKPLVQLEMRLRKQRKRGSASELNNQPIADERGTQIVDVTAKRPPTIVEPIIEVVPLHPNTTCTTLHTRPQATCSTPGLISVILPVHNHAKQLPEAIRSIQSQTWSDWELIVIDDGSKDTFDDAIAPFMADPRIRVFRQSNQKLPAALNSGFRHARGSYLTWTSADNVSLPTQFEELVGALKDNPTAGLAYSDYEAINDCGEPLTDPAFRPQNRPDGSALIRLPSEATLANLHQSEDNFIGPSFMYLADVAAVVGAYNEATFGGEDYDFWLRANLVTSFVHVGKCLYRYRIHNDTLNAKAKELDLFTNIGRLLAQDKCRRQELLIQDKLATIAPPFWRNPEQYRAEVVETKLVAYSEFVSGRASGDVATWICSRVCIIDVDLKKVDSSLLSEFDVIVTTDELIFSWLKSLGLQPSCRLLFGQADALAPAIAHCAALRFSERRQAEGPSIKSKPLPSLHPACTPQHVLLLLDRWGKGGLENVVLDLASGLARRSVRATIGLAQEQLPESLVMLATGGTITQPVSFHGDGLAMAKFLSQEGVDIVNLHHTSWGLEGPLKRVPTLYTLHNSYIWFNDEQRKHWRQMLPCADLVIAVSREVAAYAHQVFGVQSARLVVLPNGVDIAPQVLDREISNPRIRFINVASFTRLKMQDVLLRAFSVLTRQHHDAELIMVGPPLEEGYFAKIEQAAQQSEGRVKVIGGLARSDVINLVASADVFVLPSLVEGWSLSMTEAAMLGIPIIASDVGGARDLQQAGAGIVLVHPIVPDLVSLDSTAFKAVFTSNHDAFVRALASAMLTMMTDGDQIRQRAREFAPALRREFSIENMVDRYLQQFALARSVHAQNIIRSVA